MLLILYQKHTNFSMERPEFIPFFRHVVDHPECTNIDAIVYGYIYWLTKLKNEKCFASNETLAKLAGSSVTAVGNSLTKLERTGFIKRLYVDSKFGDRTEIIPLLSIGKVSPTGEGNHHPQVIPPSPTGEQSDSIEREQLSAADAETKIVLVKTDREGNEVAPKESGKSDVAFKVIAWSEKIANRRFVNKTKQLKAINLALKAGISPKQLVERWREMEDEEFWEKGFDWVNVANSFDRK